MIAKVALLRSFRFRVDEQSVVRAGVHARLTANAVVVLEIDNAILSAKQRVRRADRHTRSVFALVASHHREVPTCVWKVASLDVLHPCTIDAKRYIVFALARNRAGMAADARITVEQEPQSGHRSPIHVVSRSSNFDALSSYRTIAPTCCASLQNEPAALYAVSQVAGVGGRIQQ
jgi:hypothetical protein